MDDEYEKKGYSFDFFYYQTHVKEKNLEQFLIHANKVTKEAPVTVQIK